MKILRLFCFQSYLFFSIILCNNKYENVAFCIDLKGEVIRSGVARQGKILKGDVIYNGDKITVGLDGLITIQNIHERSEIKVFENSSIKILAKRNRVSGQKEIEVAILGGRIIINKNELNSNNLVVNSPSSNVFLRNSHFLIHCIDEPFLDQQSYCIFTSIEGNIFVENSKSKKLLFLKDGDTIISTPNGEFFQVETFRDEHNIRATLNQKLIPF